MTWDPIIRPQKLIKACEACLMIETAMQWSFWHYHRLQAILHYNRCYRASTIATANRGITSCYWSKPVLFLKVDLTSDYGRWMHMALHDDDNAVLVVRNACIFACQRKKRPSDDDNAVLVVRNTCIPKKWTVALFRLANDVIQHGVLSQDSPTVGAQASQVMAGAGCTPREPWQGRMWDRGRLKRPTRQDLPVHMHVTDQPTSNETHAW
jgi:hypothetical protein